MSTKGEGKWPEEVLLGRRKHSEDPLRELPPIAKGSALHYNETYVPKARLSEAEELLARQKYITDTVGYGARLYKARAERAEEKLKRLEEAVRYIAGEDIGGMDAHLRPKEVAQAALDSTQQQSSSKDGGG